MILVLPLDLFDFLLLGLKVGYFCLEMLSSLLETLEVTISVSVVFVVGDSLVKVIGHGRCWLVWHRYLLLDVPGFQLCVLRGVETTSRYRHLKSRAV